LEDCVAALLSAARSGEPASRPQRARAPTNGGGDVASIMSSAPTRPKDGPAADMRAKRTRTRQTKPETPESRPASEAQGELRVFALTPRRPRRCDGHRGRHCAHA